MTTVADYVMQFLLEAGIKHVFMVTGGGAMYLNDAIRRSGIEYICNLHEQASAMAAETYAKITGDIGVCVVTAGPGGTNTITGVAGAWLDSTPCLFISGQVKRADLKGDRGVRQLGVQEVDIVSIVRSITKYAVTVTEPTSIRQHLEQAVHLARTGRPGPVWLDLPLDVQGGLVDPSALKGRDEVAALPDDGCRLTKSADAALRLLNEAERPILLIGNGVRLAQAHREVLELIDRLAIPVLTTWLSHDLVHDGHPLLVGRPGPVAPRGANFALQNADFLLSIGARLDLVLTGYAPERFARAAKKVVVDVDAAEIAKLGAMVDLPIQADAKRFLRALLDGMGVLEATDRSAWSLRCKAWKEQYPVVLPEHHAQPAVSTYLLADVLSTVLRPDDVIVSGSSGAGIEIFLLALRVKQGQRVLLTTALGAMGYGLPASIGACLASGRRRTICVDGDGGIQLNIQELETIVRLQLPIKLFVLNNDGYSSIRTSQTRYFGHVIGADRDSGLSLPNLQNVAQAYGMPTVQIRSTVDLNHQVCDILERPGPVLCEVMSPRDEVRAPSLHHSGSRTARWCQGHSRICGPFSIGRSFSRT